MKKTQRGEPQNFFNEVVLQYDGDECLIWPYSRTRKGYGRIAVGGKMAQVHRLVCIEIHGQPPTPEHQAAHFCGNGRLGCINPKHLRWATHTENQRDKVLHGTHTRGERCPTAKLTEVKAREIIALKFEKSQRVIAEIYGVSLSLIQKIHSGRAWGWMQP